MLNNNFFLEKGTSISNSSDTQKIFQCKSGEYLPIESKCNFVPECKDGSDEKKCRKFTSVFLFFILKYTVQSHS